MEVIGFKQANLKLKCDGEDTLIAGRALDSKGGKVVIIKYQLELEEIKDIDKNGCIYLAVASESIPKINITTSDPYSKKEGYQELSTKGMPKNFPHRIQLRDIVFKVFYDKKTMSKEYFNEFLGYLNNMMPMTFPQISEMIDRAISGDKLRSEKEKTPNTGLSLSDHFANFEKLLSGHMHLEKDFRKHYNQNKEQKSDAAE